MVLFYLHIPLLVKDQSRSAVKSLSVCVCVCLFVCLFVDVRALYLMTKRNFRSPGLQHKNKWSDNFHDFLRCALQKEPKKRPMAQELLKVRGEGSIREGWVWLYAENIPYM